MRTALQKTEKDIRDCCAMCEKYTHKRFIGAWQWTDKLVVWLTFAVKLFDGARWEARLAAFDAIFKERRDELSSALHSNVAHGVDTLKRTTSKVQAQTQVTSQNTAMLLLFKQLESPKERELLRFIEERGGATACSENEKVRCYRTRRYLDTNMKPGSSSRRSSPR